MRKFIPLLFCLTLLTACGTATVPDATETNPPAAVAGVANPWTEHATLADAESAVGFKLSAPDHIEGYDAPIYRTLSGVMLEVLYPGKNGEVRIRKQAATDTVGNDISGDYNEYTEYTAISATCKA